MTPWPFWDNPEQFAELEVDLGVTTSNGSEYGGRMLHGGLSSGEEGWYARFEYQHAPALDASAS